MAQWFKSVQDLIYPFLSQHAGDLSCGRLGKAELGEITTDVKT
jgi:hypothetical protein